MLFAVIVAFLVASIAVIISVIIQNLAQRAGQRVIAQKKNITDLARKSGGVVTPRMIARELSISPHDADRLLRSMVDDTSLSMDIDVQAGELRFTFAQLVSEMQEDSRGSRGKSSIRNPR